MAGARTQSAPPDTSAETDDTLLTVRAAEGDEDAFAVLVQRHAPSLIRLATSLLGTAAEAEDAVQDAFRSTWPAPSAAPSSVGWLPCRPRSPRRGSP